MLWGSARHAAERPATFRDVLEVGEFRAIYGASTLSWFGDYVARAAITALVFHSTQSVAASAAAFAISYAPWLLGGSVLVSVAERYPYRSVMIICDLARALLMLCVAMLDLSTFMVLALVLASAFFSPPFDAARSATLPSILTGDRYVVGIGLQNASAPPVQVTGYVVGASLAAVSAQGALLINAGTFAVSALFIALGVRQREPGLTRARRTHLLRETAEGFRLVFATPALRALVLGVFCGAMFVVVPEGLGAAWAAQLSKDNTGWTQGMIMASVPAGSILGSLTISRFVAPANRRRLLRPLAIISPLALVPALLGLPAIVVALLAGTCGFCVGAMVPIANGMFVQALPNSHRARAFGVVSGGLQIVQGAAVLLTGLLAHRYPVSVVVGAWSLGGLVLMAILVLTWPPQRSFDDAVADAVRANSNRPGRHAAPDQRGPTDPTDPADQPDVIQHDMIATPPARPRGLARLVTTAARRRAPAGPPGTMEP